MPIINRQLVGMTEIVNGPIPVINDFINNPPVRRAYWRFFLDWVKRMGFSKRIRLTNNSWIWPVDTGYSLRNLRIRFDSVVGPMYARVLNIKGGGILGNALEVYSQRQGAIDLQSIFDSNYVHSTAQALAGAKSNIINFGPANIKNFRPPKTSIAASTQLVSASQVTTGSVKKLASEAKKVASNTAPRVDPRGFKYYGTNTGYRGRYVN